MFPKLAQSNLYFFKCPNRKVFLKRKLFFPSPSSFPFNVFQKRCPEFCNGSTCVCVCVFIFQGRFVDSPASATPSLIYHLSNTSPSRKTAASFSPFLFPFLPPPPPPPFYKVGKRTRRNWERLLLFQIYIIHLYRIWAMDKTSIWSILCLYQPSPPVFVLFRQLIRRLQVIELLFWERKVNNAIKRDR